MRRSLSFCSHHHGLIVQTDIQGRDLLHTLFYYPAGSPVYISDHQSPDPLLLVPTDETGRFHSHNIIYHGCLYPVLGELMTRQHVIFILLVAAGLALMMPAVAGALSDIPQGGVIFIGERGLNLIGVTAGAQVAWWGPGRSPSTDAPTDLQTISDPKNFFVSPTIYGTETGVWYTYPDRKTVFTIKDPTLAVRVINVRTDREVTSGTVSGGDQVKFQVDTNMYTMTERPGVNGVPITIHVLGPQGIDYTSLTDKSKTVHSLDPVIVTSSLYDTGAVWNTGNAQYPKGSYMIWAECNANNMNDEYPVAGKTTTKNTATGLTVEEGDITVTLVQTATAPTSQQTTPPTVSSTGTGMTVQTSPSATTTGLISTPQTSPVTTSPVPSPSPKAGGFTAGTTCLLLLAGASIALLQRR